MNSFLAQLNRILKDLRFLRRWRRFVLFWASVCVFVTTYNLILPAISVEKDNADNVSGLYLEDAEEIDEDQYTQANPTSDDIVTDAPIVHIQETPNRVHEKSTDINELSACGDSYEIFVTYDDKAEIPDGAQLEVQEIKQDPEASNSGQVTQYDEYIDSTSDTLGCDAGLISYARVFDISIVKDGEKIDPKDTAVDVRCELSDAVEENELSVVNFTEGAEEGSVVENSVDGQTVEFAAGESAVYVIVGTTIEKTVLASDGLNYRITATYGPEAEIPENVDLEVSELMEGSSIHGKSYEEYVANTENALGMTEGSAKYIRLFDIKIVDKDDSGVKYQPAQGTTVDVRIELADSGSDRLDVVHFSDDTQVCNVLENSTEVVDTGSAVEFAADSFSVYVIVNHEGDEEIVTPRVEFHFIDSFYTETTDSDTGIISYTANAYEFVNKHSEYQTTQILQDGEGLEKINNPANIIIQNPNGTTSEKYFYGWYIVDGSGTENIIYRWTEDPFNVPFETEISVTYDDNTDPNTVTWELNGTEFVYEADELGCAHVYLAPLYEDYYFVNFHMDEAGSDSGLKNSLLTRKLIAFGIDGVADVRIGNVMCPSPDARHQVFVGWQEENAGADYYATVDEDGNEVNSAGSSDGYYITIEKDADESKHEYDLYPVFAEARWIYYNTGMSGNGSSYVGAQYRLTNDEGRGNSLTSLPVPTRTGYVFKGWYTEQDSEFNGTGTQLTDGTGSFVDSIKGQTISSGADKAYEVTSDGNLYFYKGLSHDGLTAYARWEPETVDYTVVYWLQNANDDDYTLMHYETKQGVAGTQTQAVLIPENSPVYTDNKLRFSHLSEDQDPDSGGNQSGIQQKVIEGDGSTIVNVYYDRDVYTLRFDIGFAQRTNTSGTTTTYSQMTEEEASEYAGTVYGTIDGNLVELTPDGNGGYTYPGTLTTRHDYDGYRYQATSGNEMPQYGVVNGNVVDLDGSVGYIYNWQYYRNYWRAAGANTTLYIRSGNTYTASGYSTSSAFASDPGSDTYYIYNNNGYRQARTNGVSSTVSNFTYNNSTAYGNGPRYHRVDNEDDSTAYNLGFIGGTMQTISHDSSGWYYNTDEPAAISYTGTLYKQITETGTWNYYVSLITNTDNYNEFLTNTDANLGSTMPGEFLNCQTYTETVNGRLCKVYYYDLTAKYGENILDRYPGSQSRKGNYSFVGWIPQQDSYFWATQKTSIKGFFETMSEDLILTGAPYTNYNSGKQNVSSDSCTAITSENGNITQEFRCRYTRNSNNYLYRIYLADPDTLDYPTEPNDKYVITAGTSSYPNMQTPPTYQGYHLVDTKELSSVTDTVGANPAGSYRNPYAIPELTAAGLTSGRIISFKFQPNNHKLAFQYGSGADQPNTFVDPSHEYYTYYYGQSLANADIYTQTAIVNTPEGHTFAGWYENPDGIGDTFNFNSTMPDGDIILYAVYKPLKYRVKIDPNGAEIDHIDHTGAAYTGTYRGIPYSVETFNRDAIEGERPADSGYNPSQSTYFNADFGEPVGEYVLTRNYVPISDAVAETYEGKIYYYINTQFQTTDGKGLPPALRNALYLTEGELEEYYRFYHEWLQTNQVLMPEDYQGTQLLSFAAWKQLYVSDQKYRKCNSKESYIFLGWYKDNEKMPYNFEDPVDEPFTLTAKWRLDGGYTIQYHTDFVMGDGTKINGSLPSWIDPQAESATLSYADGADTNISRQPDSITADGVLIEDDSYIFRGWRLVALRTDGGGNTVYVPLEEGVYYDPDDDFVVQAAFADADSVIHMQAVYEKKSGAYRRPEIANLTLDANTGFISEDGSSELTENTDLTDTWTGRVGTVAATVTTDAGDTEIIEFGDIQSNEEVHLYKYATETGVIASDGKNYFVHLDGYFLIGFDDESNEGDYAATYPSDSVISVQRTDRETIYAVWEPMVYITFKNETEVGDVALSLTSSDASALQVVNMVDGTYTRTPLENLGGIIVPKDESVTLAIPYGAEKGITVSGTNTLGTGNVLTWSSAVTLDDTLYENTDYSHTFGEDTHSHTLPFGQTDNGKPFSFDETLITDRTGLIVTFESKPNDYTIVLNDNYEGGGTQEYNYEPEEVLTGDGDPKTARLPNTSTRIGYELIGWAFDPEATTPDYSSANEWTVNNLEEFFLNAETTDNGTKVETLYAVWKASADQGVVKVYKEVPLPGSRSQDFTFTVGLSGTFRPNGSTSTYDLAAGADSSKTFAIKHGGYLLITDTNSTGSTTSRAYVQAIVQVFDINGVEDESQRKIVRWQHSSNTAGSFNGSEKINVTETPADHYGTEMTRVAQTSQHPLKLENDSNTTEIPYTVTGRTVSFDTFAGGTVVYTNTRDTKDISVEKQLFSNTSATAQFGFSASYELDGVTKNLGTFYVSSGSANTEALKAIPAGAILTITEVADNNYDTKVAIGSEPAEESKITTFTVTDDATVTFKNTLKSYPVRIVKVDQDGTAGAVEAFFTLASETGTIGTNLYTSEENYGLIYNSEALFVGSYTLTETWTEDGYHGLSEPVTINVTGDGVSCSDGNVIVTGNAVDGYVVTVYNVETKEITITKELIDPLITQRQFDFTFTYEYSPVWLLSEDTVTETEQFTFVPTTTTPATKTIRVPVGAKVIVSEDVSELSGIYDTTVAMGSGNPLTAASYTIDEVSDDATIAFTNTRKNADITVKKVVAGTTDENSFTFTATLRNGAEPVTVYTVYQDTNNSSNHLITNAEGTVGFSLANEETQVLSVPVGAKLVIREDEDNYAVSIMSANNTTDEDTSEKSFTMTVTTNDTITFTNSPAGVQVALKKAGVDNTDQSHTQWALGGAEFSVYTAKGAQLDQKDRLVVVDNQSLVNLVSNETTGMFWSGILPTGTYIIEENSVPSGYNKLSVLIRMEINGEEINLSPIGITGNSESIYNTPVKQNDTWTITIINTIGVTLPSTGGHGTRSIYLFGILLTGISGLFLITRKRRSVT